MIGHFLGTLTVEQEDRVLTEVMRPGSWDAPCLLGVAHPKPARFRQGIETDGAKYFIRGYGYHAWTQSVGVATDYDDLCYRFGAPRVNAAIRNRILSNRARRALTWETPLVGVGASRPTGDPDS